MAQLGRHRVELLAGEAFTAVLPRLLGPVRVALPVRRLAVVLTEPRPSLARGVGKQNGALAVGPAVHAVVDYDAGQIGHHVPPLEQPRVWVLYKPCLWLEM